MSGRGDPTMREYPVGLLNQRYLVVLVLVALLVLLNQVLVQPPLLQLTTDAPVINIAGRQRMLSQRLAKAALALGGAADEVDRRRHRAELGHVLRLWSVSHNGLRHGDRALSLPGRNSPAVREAFDDLEPFFTRMCAAVARLIGNDALRRPDDAAAHEDLATILENEGEYLARMDRIVGLFEGEARARVDRLLWTGWAVTVLILVALGAIGLFVSPVVSAGASSPSAWSVASAARRPWPMPAGVGRASSSAGGAWPQARFLHRSGRSRRPRPSPENPAGSGTSQIEL